MTTRAFTLIIMHTCNKDAIDFLCNSLDEELLNIVYETCEEDDSFVAYWLSLIHIIRSVSIERCEKIKQRLKDRKISQCSGENVEAICSDYLRDYEELRQGNMYDHKLTLVMINRIMEAGGASNEDFRYQLRKTKNRLRKASMKIRTLDYAKADEYIKRRKLDVLTVLNKAKDEYWFLYDEKNWPAATNACT